MLVILADLVSVAPKMTMCAHHSCLGVRARQGRKARLLNTALKYVRLSERSIYHHR